MIVDFRSNLLRNLAIIVLLGQNLRADSAHEVRDLQGWKLHIHRDLLVSNPELTRQAIELLDQQLQEVSRVVPQASVTELRKVPLYFSPEYPKIPPRAEYHPAAQWLRENGRDPIMAKAIEFTNIRIFKEETSRMPNFALHELAHAFHDRVLPDGFENKALKTTFIQAKRSGKYVKVERSHGNNRPNTIEKAYALTNAMEYFAETTEAFFARNDFFPFTREELQRHDPEMFALLKELWQ